MTLQIPKIACDPTVVTQGQRYAVFRPKLLDADGQPTAAPMKMDCQWTTAYGWSSQGWKGGDYVPASGGLTWAAGNIHPNEGPDIVVALGDNALKRPTGQLFQIRIHVLGDAGGRPGYTDVYAPCILQVAKDAERPAIWSLPMDQASLDAIRPTTPLRSTFRGYNFEGGETGVDVYNGQLGGVRPFFIGADQRVHLRCVPLPSPVKDYKGASKSIGQARLISPETFQRGDLIEWDVQHVTPGWLITWTTGEFGWPYGGEIDMEYRPDWCAAVTDGLNLVQHYNGASASGLGGITPTGVDMTKPHVRSLEWTPDDQIVARMNGVEVQRWPMLWNGDPQIVVVQATAYTALKSTDPMPELSLGAWTHYRAKAA